MLSKLRGSVQQPVPGTHSDRIPTGIVDSTGRTVKAQPSKAPVNKQPASQPSTRLARAPRARKVFEKDVHKYGATPGCRACTEVLLGRKRSLKEPGLLSNVMIACVHVGRPGRRTREHTSTPASWQRKVRDVDYILLSLRQRRELQTTWDGDA